MSGLEFIKLKLQTKTIAIGERIKRGTFRPCVETIPTSTLMGCFREYFGFSNTVAIGTFVKATYRKTTFTYAPFDSMLETAKLPLTLECLAPSEGRENIEADIFVCITQEANKGFVKDNGPWTVALGAFKTKGFGQSVLEFSDIVKPKFKTGYLLGRMRESDAKYFGIKIPDDIICPRYGYLFRPDKYHIGGKYERALFMGTILTGPDFLIGEEYCYDR